MHFLQGTIWTNDVTCSLVQTWARLASASFQPPPYANGVKSPCAYCTKITRSVEIWRCRVYFIPIKAELERKPFCFTFFVCVSETNSVLWKHSLYPVGADIFIYVYICWCVYICIQCKGCIYSLHAAGNCHFTALPEPTPCHSEADRLPPHHHVQGLTASQAAWRVVIKQ